MLSLTRRLLAFLSLFLLASCGEKTPVAGNLFTDLARELDAAKTVLAGVSQPAQAPAARETLGAILDRMDALQRAAMDRMGGSDNDAFKTWQTSLAGVRAELARLEKASPETAKELAPVLARLKKYF